MLSRRIPGGFVCLRCQLSLASRTRARPSPLRRTPNANIAPRNAPSRNYSDSAEKPVWKGRLPGQDEVEERLDPRREVDDQALDPETSSEPTHDNAKSIANEFPWAHSRTQESDQADENQRRELNNTRSSEEGEVEVQKVPHQADGEPRPIPIRYHYVDGGQAPSPGTLPANRPLRRPLDALPEFYVAKGGSKLEPVKRDLPIDILGRPAHALIMRDAGLQENRKLKQLNPVRLSKAEQSKNRDRVNEATQTDAPTSDEVLQNLHELRPSESVLTQREFETLKKTIYKGFTQPQLAAYIQRESQVEQDQDKTQLHSSPWILEQWPWAPELKSEFKTDDALLQGYVSRSTPGKERLVIILMRRCWGLGIREIQGQPGYLDVRVQDLQFDLLMLGNRRWLESISKSLFEPGTQIELIRSQRIVRIVGPKATAEMILQEINILLEQAQSRSWPAAEISPKPLDQSILDFVGQFTHTVIRYDKTRKNIQVSWITPSPETEKREGLEDVGDVTFRLLYSAYGYKQAGDATMEVQPEPYAVGGWYLPDYHSKPKMAWKDRLAEWARWTIATPRRAAKPTDPVTVLNNDVLLSSLDASTSSNSFASDGWSSEPQVRSKAVFGHVLHRAPAEPDVEGAFEEKLQQDSPVSRNSGIDAKLDSHLDRTLTPIIPPLKSLASLTSTSKSTTTQISIILRFLPAPTGNSPSTPVPSLEFALQMDPDTYEITPHSLRAVSRVATHDILLPSHPVDIRLTETTSHVLPGHAIGDACPEMMAFLASSDLRPSEGVLSTPARPPTLRLPSRILSSSLSSTSTSPTSLSASPPSDSTSSPETDRTPATYIFSGLELHRQVSTSLSGWRLSYTSVEAGQGGGRRAELALEGVRVTDDNPEGDSGSDRPLSDFERFEREMNRLGDLREKKSEEKKTRASREYLDTLSRLALGGEVAWYGEMPERVGGESEGGDGAGGGEGDGEE